MAKKRIGGTAAAVIVLALVLMAAIFIFRAQHGRVRVYVFGLDGATWDILDPLIEDGRLPVFKKLKEDSSWARLQTFEPTLSAVVWTSIATGKNMIKHGIVDWIFVNKENIKVPFTGSMKRVPSIWEMLDEKGKRSIVLGWFVTYPPDAINGAMVSDSFAPALFRSFNKKIDHPDFSDTVHPESEFEKLREYFKKRQEAGDFKYPRLVREMNIPDYLLEYKQRYGQDARKVSILGVWGSFLVYNRIEDLLVDYYLRTKDYDLFLAYYRFPDVFLHFATLFLEKEYHDRIEALVEGNQPLTPEILAEFNRRMADVALPLLKDKEIMLAKIYEQAVREKAYLIILSDHGFQLTSKGYNHYGLPAGTPPPDGILMVLGPGVKSNQRIEASVYDIAPTILYLQNLPVGQDMDGRPLLEAFDVKKPVRYSIYSQMKHSPEKRNPDMEQKKLEELKSLGYLK